MLMKKFFQKNKFYFLFFFLVFILVLAFIYLNYYSNFKYSFREQGFLFVSNYNDPLPLISNQSKEQSFIVVASFTEEQSQINSLMANYSLIPLVTVLSGNKKELMILAKIYNGKELIKCLTNYGNIKENTEIKKEECIKLLEDQKVKHITIEILFPDDSLNETLIEVEKDSITIKPKNFKELQAATILLLKTMFSNTEQIIKNANIISNYVIS
jgi:hypothetical protein